MDRELKEELAKFLKEELDLAVADADADHQILLSDLDKPNNDTAIAESTERHLRSTNRITYLFELLGRLTAEPVSSSGGHSGDD